MRPVKVRRSQDLCLHASTGKAQAYCSLSKSGVLNWHWHLRTAFRGNGDYQASAWLGLLLFLRINFENTGTLLPMLLLMVFFFTS